MGGAIPPPAYRERSNMVCAHCGSNNTQQGFDALQCLDCGHRTNHQGRKLPVEPVFDGENPHDRRPT